MLAEIQARRSGLRKTTELDPAAAAAVEEAKAAARALQSRLEKQIRAYTGIHTDQERTHYYHKCDMERWYPAVEDVTFPTVFLEMSLQEKAAILHEFYYGEGENWRTFDAGAVKLDSELNKKLRRMMGACLGKDLTVDDHSAAPAMADTVHQILLDLSLRITEQIKYQQRSFGHFPDGVFVKLSSSSPKDSPLIFAKAKEALERMQKGTTGEASASHTVLWREYYASSVKAQQVREGWEAIELLTTSEKVALDLQEDLLHLLKHQMGASQAESQLQSVPGAARSSTAQASDVDSAVPVRLCLRAFDPRVSPSFEFRGFVVNGQVTGITQTLLMLKCAFQGVEIEAVKEDILAFFDRHMKPKIGVEDGLPSHFAMDLFYLPGKSDSDSKGATVRLVEINPFDLENWSAYKASTGLFDYKKLDRFLSEPEGDFNMLTGGMFTDSGQALKDRVHVPELRYLKEDMSRGQIEAMFSKRKDLLKLIYGESGVKGFHKGKPRGGKGVGRTGPAQQKGGMSAGPP